MNNACLASQPQWDVGASVYIEAVLRRVSIERGTPSEWLNFFQAAGMTATTLLVAAPPRWASAIHLSLISVQTTRNPIATPDLHPIYPNPCH
jgi:hypothetical protein